MLDKPDGLWGWAKSLFFLSFGIGGLLWLINKQFLDYLLGAPGWLRVITGVLLVVLAFALEYIDYIEPDDAPDRSA